MKETIYVTDFSRKELFDMTTTELYTLNGELTKLQERVKGELIARGDY